MGSFGEKLRKGGSRERLRMGSFRVCVCFTRKFRVTETAPPPDVVEAFINFSECQTHMTPEQLRRFLVDVQGNAGATISDAQSIVQQVLDKRHHIAKFTRHSLNLDDFHHYLFSPDLNPPLSSQVNQDMTAPMSHYFIYTGHNSYLTGNQLNSACSDVPIIKALKRGVRVIELDLWPDSKLSKDAVHVKHGGTLTPPVDLLTCLKSIKEHAFSASPYPVVITLEDHLTSNLQAKVAQMLTQTFGKMLYCPDLESLKELPSPEELKYRVIISTKPPKEYLEDKSIDNQNHSCKRKDSDDDSWYDEPINNTDDQENDEESDVDGQNQDAADSHYLDQMTETSPEYRLLIALHSGKPKGGLREALKVEVDKVRRLSLSEQGLEKAVKSHGLDVVRFTQKNMLRIYPKGTRFNSSNYKPLIGWMHGAQMVAFNMQGYGKNLWLMHGMFRANGGCGYFKKPDFLIKASPDNQVFDPKVKLPVKKTLKVKVYMGDGWHLDFEKTYFDLYSPPDFYTKLNLTGVPADGKKQKTAVRNNNWNPVWNEEFEFPLTVPELAILRIEVRDADDVPEEDDFGGQNCLPVSEIRPGIRAVPLYDRKGVKYPSVRLLMHFELV